MRVIIIPEDQSLDRYILQPIVETLFRTLKIPAKVSVLPEPRLRGTSDALDPVQIRQIITRYPMVDLFLLMVDRDCNREGNEARVAELLRSHPDKLLACVAHQEIEVFLLALHRDKLDESWANIRNHCDPKEAYAEPFLETQSFAGPGRGRKQAMQTLPGHFRSLCSLCDELQHLSDDIVAFAGRLGTGGNQV